MIRRVTHLISKGGFAFVQKLKNLLAVLWRKRKIGHCVLLVMSRDLVALERPILFSLSRCFSFAARVKSVSFPTAKCALEMSTTILGAMIGLVAFGASLTTIFCLGFSTNTPHCKHSSFRLHGAALSV